MVISLLGVLLRSAAAALRTRRHLLLENLAQRQQLSVFLATAHRRPSLTEFDRTFWTVLRAYLAYYQRLRTDLSLDKDAPNTRDVQPPAMVEVIELPEVGGLRHRYERRAA